MNGLCDAEHCGQLAVTTLSGDSQTLRRLGFLLLVDRLQVRVCAKCYLLAMGEVLARANLPKPDPLRAEYFCSYCNQPVAAAAVRYDTDGRNPYHAAESSILPKHPVSFRIVRP